MNNLAKQITWLTLFSIAMGFLETAVVVYLRRIYYPEGFDFPLVPIEPGIAVTELLREAATVIMLAGIGILSGKTPAQKFAFFIYSFAVWDLFYYVFLWLLLSWPASLFTWDILFLIPVPWVGPVLAPCLVSLTMILLAACIVYFEQTGKMVRISKMEWMVLIIGSAVVVGSFVIGYFEFIHRNAVGIWSPDDKEAMLNSMKNYIPSGFNWWLFMLGEFIIITAIAGFSKRIYDTGKTS